MAVVLYAFGYSIDMLPFHFSDIILAFFAFGGVIYWVEFDVLYIINKFIEWFKETKLFKKLFKKKIIYKRKNNSVHMNNLLSFKDYVKEDVSYYDHNGNILDNDEVKTGQIVFNENGKPLGRITGREQGIPLYKPEMTNEGRRRRPADKTAKDMEEAERRRWKRIEAEELNKEKKMKRDAEKDLADFFDDEHRDTKTSTPHMDEPSRFKEMEMKELKRMRKLQQDELEKERDMKIRAQKDQTKFFKDMKRDTSRARPMEYNEKPTPDYSPQRTSSVPSGLHYKSTYKQYKPKTAEKLKRFIDNGNIEQVTYGEYHFSVKGNNDQKYYFKFVNFDDLDRL
jgi:hypothetical protein